MIDAWKRLKMYKRAASEENEATVAQKDEIDEGSRIACGFENWIRNQNVKSMGKKKLRERTEDDTYQLLSVGTNSIRFIFLLIIQAAFASHL